MRLRKVKLIFREKKKCFTLMTFKYINDFLRPSFSYMNIYEQKRCFTRTVLLLGNIKHTLAQKPYFTTMCLIKKLTEVTI